MKTGKLTDKAGRLCAVFGVFSSKHAFVSFTVVRRKRTDPLLSLFTAQSWSLPFPHYINFICRVFDFFCNSLLKLISVAQEDRLNILLEMFGLFSENLLVKITEDFTAQSHHCQRTHHKVVSFWFSSSPCFDDHHTIGKLFWFTLSNQRLHSCWIPAPSLTFFHLHT